MQQDAYKNHIDSLLKMTQLKQEKEAPATPA